MPLGTEQFVARFGAEELLALTDPTERANVKTEVFDAAAQDAFAEVSSILSNVMTLEADALPDIVVAILADLTRHRLYIDAAPQAVASRTMQARALLTKLAAGSGSGAIQTQQTNPVDVRISTQGTGFTKGIWT